MYIAATSCPKPPPLMNGRVSTTIKEDNSREIHTAVYSCDVGYYLDSNETRECVREIDEQIGQWTSSPPACICELLTKIILGSIDVYNACNYSATPL